MSLPRLAVILVAALALFVGADNIRRPLAHPDEGRYSEIAREMAASGVWVTPRLNGIKYFEKPPLQYWAGAASFSVLGESEVAARLYTALCGLLTLLAVGFTARRLAGGDAALLAVGVLLSSPYFMGLAAVVTLDMGLTAWTTVAACAFLLAVAGPEEGRRRWMLLAWAGMALAVLSKGLIGVVFPAAAIFLHCLANRDWRLLAKHEWLRGGALFLALAAPWFVLVSIANPEFARFLFVHEHFERFLAYAAMVKSVDAYARVCAPEEWGWSGYFYSGFDQQAGAANGWQHFPDRSTNGGWASIPWFLDQARQQVPCVVFAAAVGGNELVHVPGIALGNMPAVRRGDQKRVGIRIRRTTVACIEAAARRAVLAPLSRQQFDKRPQPAAVRRRLDQRPLQGHAA